MISRRKLFKGLAVAALATTAPFAFVGPVARLRNEVLRPLTMSDRDKIANNVFANNALLERIRENG